jgi:threonine dehydratase
MSHASAREGIAVSSSLATARHEWVDVTKGLCILLVVLYHVVDKQYLQSFDLPGLARAGWTAVIMGLVPLRMPVFFLVSGFLASKSLHRPWDSALGPRVLSPYYLYVVWLAIHLLWFLFAPDIADEHHQVNSLGEVLLNLVIGLTSLWYLYALAAYFVIAKLALRARWATVAIFALVNIVVEAHWLPIGGQFAALLQNVVFFLVAIYAPEWVARLAHPHLRKTRAIAGVVGLALLLVIKRQLGLDDAPGMLLALSCLSCLGAVSTTAWACSRSLSGTRVLGILGRATLPIYVLHILVVSAIQFAIPMGGDISLPGGAEVAFVYPVVITAVVVGISLAIRWLLLRVGLRALFTAPSWVVRIASVGRSTPDVTGCAVLNERATDRAGTLGRAVPSRSPADPRQILP